jgi:hypothetical protein
MIFILYYSKNGRLVEFIEIFRYPLSKDEDGLGEELSEVPDRLYLVGFGVSGFGE